MSTDLHDRPRQPSPDEGPDRRETPKTSISVAQIVGGALAAMTAAALGSRLSVAGTVVGAALASVVAALAGAVYTSSLRRTSRGVSTVIARVRPPSSNASTPASDAPTSVEPAAGWVLPADSTAIIPATSGSETGIPGTGDLGPVVPGTAAPTRRSRLGWKQVLVAALLMFLVAALVLTGIELATGRALSGGNGTTVGQVADPATRPSPTPTTRSTPTPSVTPSATASTGPSATAVPSTTPSDEPTAQPTPSSSPAPSVTPSVSASPTPVAPSAPGATPSS